MKLKYIIAALVLSLAFCPAGVRAADAPKVIRKGGIIFYPDQKRIEIEGKFCLAEGPIDLLLCAKGGKEYESVISAEMSPEILHFCLILMGLKPGETGPQKHGDYDTLPTGSPLSVKVKWTDGAAERIVPGEDLCWNAVDKRTIERTPWVFVGSRKEKDLETGAMVYWANVEKSVISVIPDPYAVVNLPFGLRINYGDYAVNKQVIPKVGTACTVIIEPAPAFPPPPKNGAGGRIVHVDMTGGARVLLDGVLPEELPAALKKIAKDGPKDSCRVTIDHGCPAETIATGFEALAAAGVAIESVETVRQKPDVADVLAVHAAGDKMSIQGKELTDAGARALIQERAKKGSGIAVNVAKETTLACVVRAVRACGGVEEAVVRVNWGGGTK